MGALALTVLMEHDFGRPDVLTWYEDMAPERRSIFALSVGLTLLHLHMHDLPVVQPSGSAAWKLVRLVGWIRVEMFAAIIFQSHVELSRYHVWQGTGR